MKRILSVLLVATLSVPMMGAPNAALADDGGRIVAGVAGGFLGGMLLGSVLAPHPAPRYYGADPVYYDPPPCHFEPAEPYWDGYYGVWRHRRIRVCD